MNKVNEAAASKIDQRLTAAINTTLAAVASLKAAVEQAVRDYRALGLDDAAIAKRVKGLFVASTKANTVNKALRAAGVRQRGLRCDAGLTRDGGVRFSLGVPREEDGDGGAGGEGDGDDDEDGGDKVPAARRLAEMALKLCGGDKAAAKAALAAAAKSV